MSGAIRERSGGASPEVKRIAWKAQERLHKRYCCLSGRGMTRQKVISAIARELAGFVWAISNEKQLAAQRRERQRQPAAARAKGEPSQ
jgi:hypothetical protein